MDGWLVEEALRRIRVNQRTAIVETYIGVAATEKWRLRRA